MTGNYSFEHMERRAAEALEFHQPYVASALSQFSERLTWRRKRQVPTLAILGNGRSGKDEVSGYIASQTDLKYGGSSSTGLCYFVSHMIGLPYERAWEERHSHREFWIAAGDLIRSADITLLCRLTLGLGDFAVGLRGRYEIHSCVTAGVVDALVWIDRDVPADPTMELQAGDCDIVVPNYGSRVELYRKLDKLIYLFQLPAKGSV